MTRVTTSTNIPVDSLFSNYLDYYEDWLDAETEECPDCYGTGMDRNELYECETCAGEGEIIVSLGP